MIYKSGLLPTSNFDICIPAGSAAVFTLSTCATLRPVSVSVSQAALVLFSGKL